MNLHDCTNGLRTFDSPRTTGMIGKKWDRGLAWHFFLNDGKFISQTTITQLRMNLEFGYAWGITDLRSSHVQSIHFTSLKSNRHIYFTDNRYVSHKNENVCTGEKMTLPAPCHAVFSGDTVDNSLSLTRHPQIAYRWVRSIFRRVIPLQLCLMLILEVQTL